MDDLYSHAVRFVSFQFLSFHSSFHRFCGLKGHEMFCEVERSYIEDGFNLYGLRACVSNFSDCLDLILDRIGPDDSDDSHLTQSACTLYGLIHARYIITAHGLDAMYNKVSDAESIYPTTKFRNERQKNPLSHSSLLLHFARPPSFFCFSFFLAFSLSLYSTLPKTLVPARSSNVNYKMSCPSA